jgi:hypothetical protein
MNKHQLNLSGGSNNTTYYMSGEYLKQEGVAAGSGFDRYGFRLNSITNQENGQLLVSTLVQPNK